MLLDLVAAGLLYLRVPTYADWHVARRPQRALLALRDGALIGLAFGTVALFFSAARQGGAVAPGSESLLIWLVVLTLVGAMTAALAYAFVALAAPSFGLRPEAQPGRLDRRGALAHPNPRT